MDYNEYIAKTRLDNDTIIFQHGIIKARCAEIIEMSGAGHISADTCVIVEDNANNRRLCIIPSFNDFNMCEVYSGSCEFNRAPTKCYRMTDADAVEFVKKWVKGYE